MKLFDNSPHFSQQTLESSSTHDIHLFTVLFALIVIAGAFIISFENNIPDAPSPDYYAYK